MTCGGSIFPNFESCHYFMRFTNAKTAFLALLTYLWPCHNSLAVNPAVTGGSGKDRGLVKVSLLKESDEMWSGTRQVKIGNEGTRWMLRALWIE